MSWTGSALSEGSQVEGEEMEGNLGERRSGQGKGGLKWARGESSTFPSTYHVPGTYIHLLTQASSLWEAAVVADPTM